MANRPAAVRGQMVTLADVLERMALKPPSLSPGLKTSSPPKKSQKSSKPTGCGRQPPAGDSGAALQQACPICDSTGWYYCTSELEHDGFGKAMACPQCTDYLARSRLSEKERQYTIAELKGNQPAYTVLRQAIRAVTTEPCGWLTLWGGPGTSKTLTLQILIADLCRRGNRALYYHARDLEDGLWADLHNGTANGELYRKVPVLAIDEFGRLNFNSPWILDNVAAMLDHRYRNMDNQVTLIAMNEDPHQWDDDTRLGAWLSRMQDGRFNRTVGDGPGATVIPGLLHVAVPDVRPMLRR